MNESFATGDGIGAEPLELLSTEEEGALAAIRDILAGIRAMGVPLELSVVRSALKSAGASAGSGADESGGAVLHLRGTRFQLRQRHGPRGGIEICFVTGSS